MVLNKFNAKILELTIKNKKIQKSIMVEAQNFYARYVLNIHNITRCQGFDLLYIKNPYVSILLMVLILVSQTLTFFVSIHWGLFTFVKCDVGY